MRAGAGTADTVNVTGTWRAMDSEGDEQTLNLMQEGVQIRGKAWQWNVPHTISNGTVRGDSITLIIAEGDVTFTMKAKVDGDKMTDGTADNGKGHKVTWTAHRQVSTNETVTGFGLIVREFSSNRRKLLEDLSKRLDLPVPDGVDAFFKAAEAGDWVSVSNRFQTFLPTGERRDGVVPGLLNELWTPIHETLGAHEVWFYWKQKSALLESLYKPVLSSMPKGSIYFGGTDYGRFAITAANAVTNPAPVFCITQNALADSTYMAHLRAIFGDDLWIPQIQDSSRAFQQYVEDVQAGKRKANAELKIQDGRIQVAGVLGVMEINGILARMIFEHNGDAHDIFVEESYPIDWMYPYLEPHGLIMKLNTKPLDKLPDEMVKRDMEFWRNCVGNLRKEPVFAFNREAQNAFSKLRCAIAGIYVYRKRYGDAEAAFMQAMELCPASPEVNVRLAMMYEDEGKTGEALKVLKKYTGLDEETIKEHGETYGPYTPDKARKYLARLQKERVLTPGEETELAGLIGQLGAKEPQVRAGVRKRIAEFGAAARPLLKQHENADDPEVRITINELIRQLEEQDAADREK
jgi:tetratricopeptide (TPR) repeat protein